MKLSDKIADWIKKQVKKSNAGGIVLGLSGGMDSAVVAALAKRACGDNVLGLIIPCNSLASDEKDALLAAKEFDIRTHRIELSRVYEYFLEVLHESNRIAMANLKPRLRMATLYYYANMLNYLVAGTGNKCEISMGYFTKYGDGGVDIQPIGDLLKSGVTRLARELGVPGKIIKKTPSAGLWKGQTDEGEMGITYEEIEKIIVSVEKEKRSGVSREKYEKAMKMMKAAGHKRESVLIYRKGKK